MTVIGSIVGLGFGIIAGILMIKVVSIMFFGAVLASGVLGKTITR